MTACSQSNSRSRGENSEAEGSDVDAVAVAESTDTKPTDTAPPAPKETWRVAIAPGLRPFAMTEAVQPDSSQQGNIDENSLPETTQAESAEGQTQLVGFDVDLIKALGKACGASLQIESQPFDALIPMIQAARVDVAIGAVPITPARSEAVKFSDPYFQSGVAIAALPKNDQLKTLKDLRNQTIAVQLETAGARLAIDIPGSSILTFREASAALQAVEKGQADAALVALPILLDHLKTHPTSAVQKIGKLAEAHDFGIMMRPSEGPKEEQQTVALDRLSKVNAALKTLVDDGTYAKIHERWLGPLAE
ncbi:MAG: transporter substrate-binding domain-containing protein [Phormidesmis sp.]